MKNRLCFQKGETWVKYLNFWNPPLNFSHVDQCLSLRRCSNSQPWLYRTRVWCCDLQYKWLQIENDMHRKVRGQIARQWTR